MKTAHDRTSEDGHHPFFCLTFLAAVSSTKKDKARSLHLPSRPSSLTILSFQMLSLQSLHFSDMDSAMTLSIATIAVAPSSRKDTVNTSSVDLFLMLKPTSSKPLRIRDFRCTMTNNVFDSSMQKRCSGELYQMLFLPPFCCSRF